MKKDKMNYIIDNMDYFLKVLNLEKINTKDEIEVYTLLSKVNGISDCNEKINDINSFKENLKKYELDIDNIYIDLSFKDLPNVLWSYIYVYKGFFINIDFCKNFKKLFMHLKNIIKILDKTFVEGDFLNSSIFIYCPQKFNVHLFNLFSGYLEDEDLTEYGRYLFTSSDYGSNFIEEELLNKIFKPTQRKCNEFADKDGFLTLYRGMGSKSKDLEDAYSWTLNSNVAKFFATRFIKSEKKLENVNVYKIKIHKDDVMGYIGGNEEEILINPRLLMDNHNYICEKIAFDKSIFYNMPTKKD